MAWNNEEVPTKKLPSTPKNKKELWDMMPVMKDEPTKFKGAIVGPMGTGKTIQAMKLAHGIVAKEDKKEILYIDSGENWSSMKNHPGMMENVRRMRFRNYDDLIELAKFMISGEEPFSRFGAVVFDEYSSITEYDLAWIVRQRAAEKEKVKEFKDPYQPALPDYLAGMHRSNILIDTFMRADAHLIFVAHVRLDDRKWTVPDFPEATQKGFQKKLHSVMFAEVDQKKDGSNEYAFLLNPLKSQRISAKCRIGGLPNTATVEQVIEAYHKWGVKPQSKKPEKPIAVEEQPEAAVPNLVDLLDI